MEKTKKKDSVIFDILKNITVEKVDKWYEYGKRYNSFIINKFLSTNSLTIYYANEMNKSNLPDREQYYFYLYVLPQSRLFFPWIKKDEEDSGFVKRIIAISKYYEINNNRAKEYLKMLDEESINNIVKLYEVGGTG